MFSCKLMTSLICMKKYHTFSNSSSSTALSVFEKSRYRQIDFKIQESKYMKEAITRLSTLDIDCLAVTDSNNRLVGVLSQRDIIAKVCSSEKHINLLNVKESCTYDNNIFIAKTHDSIESCMNKMMLNKIRHLIVIDDKQRAFIGMISLKDIIKEELNNNKDIIARLTLENNKK